MGEVARRGWGLGGRTWLRLVAATALAMVLLGAARAKAEQVASISARFSPYRLGKPSAISLGFKIGTPEGSLPSALTGLVFRYPKQLVLGANELGLVPCKKSALQLRGPRACPSNSIMGSGTALAEFQASPVVSEENATIALVAGAPKDGHVNMLISASGAYPVKARIVMETLLLPGRLRFTVPIVEGIPEGPDVAVAKVNVTIGGRLTYYERHHGHRIAYRPRGITLPSVCPRGGFHFRATFSFLDGSSAEAGTVVRCPPGGRRRA